MLTINRLYLSLILITILTLIPFWSASNAQDSYGDSDPGNLPDPGAQADNVIESFETQGPLTFVDDQALFNGSCGALAFENFENTEAPVGGVAVCPNPINSNTGNGCYQLGTVIPGFSMNAINPPNPAQALASVSFGLGNVAAGPNFFADDLRVDFNGFVNAIGLNIITAGSSTVVVDVYSGSDFLGSALVNVAGTAGTFIGIAAQAQITHIELVNGNGELLNDLSFGSCGGIARPIPTLSEWGLIAIAGVLGIIAVLAIRRRKAAA